MNIYNELCQILGKENVYINELMSNHITFRVGGPADYFVTPETEAQLGEVLALFRKEKIPHYIIGNGSNLLVGDRGFRGVIVQICKKMNQVRIEAESVYAQAGALLSKIAAEAQTYSLTGFEFASGIPGTLGGAVMMNAGAYGGEMAQVLVKAQVMDDTGSIYEVPVERMELGYRTSVFSQNGNVVLNAELRLEKGDAGRIQKYMKELKEKRMKKQPLEYPSAGSAFKRPEGFFAGKLIQDAGLQGFQVGGAQISEKHCGFVINKNRATAADIVSLMEQVSDRVEARFGVHLEPEVKKIGEF